MRQRRRRLPRVVVDTSVLIAGISAFRKPVAEAAIAAGLLLQQWIHKGGFVWLISPDIVEEYREVAVRKHVRRHVIGRLLNLLKEAAEEVEPRMFERFSPDPKDDLFFHCAVAGKADFIVTLNPRDFPKKKLRLSIVSPTEFLGL